MKLILEKLDKGFLLIYEDAGTVERGAYETATEALEVAACALGISPAAHTRTVPVAPSPLSDDEPLPPPTERQEPPATRRIGLSQAKKSPAPAGRRY